MDEQRPGTDGAPSVEVHRYALGSWTIIRVEGTLDLRAREPIDDLLADGVSHVAFELDGVTFLDDFGLGILLDRRRRAMDGGGVVQLVAPSAPVHRLLVLTESEGLFPPMASADRAVRVLLDTDPWSVS